VQFRKGCRLWWVFLPAIALDRITKHAAMHLHGVKTAIPGVLSWAYTQNHGAAFSILSGRGALLSLLTIALISALLVYLIRHPQIPATERTGLWMIIGGGLGNLFDRIFYGYVVDFIRLDFVRFAIFNVADIFVCAGAALVVLSVLIAELRGKKHG